MGHLIPYAPLFASTVAVIAILSGLWQFRRTQQLTREVKAVELFLKFNELNQQLASVITEKERKATFWQHNALVAITEAVYRLTIGDQSWEATVSWMLKAQEPFLTQSPVNCQSFSREFVTKMKLAIPNMKCC